MAARAILLRRLSASVLPLKDDDNIIDLCDRSNGGHYRNLILQIFEITPGGQHPITSGLGWEVYGISPVGSMYKLAQGRSRTLGEDFGPELTACNALIQGFDFLLKNGVTAKTLLIESDSKIVVNQMTGASQVRDPNLVKAYGVAKRLENSLKYNGTCLNIHFQHTSF